MDRLELQRVSNESYDDVNSVDSIDNCYTEPIDSEKATISSQYADEDDAESQKFLTNGFPPKKKYEEFKGEYHPGTTSFGMSVFNLSNAIMGSGILGLSYAMANTGIVLFVVMLIAVSILSLYSVHLLLKTAKEGGSLIYEKLGERAFGWPGKLAAFGAITLQNIGAMSSYLFIVKYELPEVIRSFMGLQENSGEWYLNGNYLIVIVSIAIILPLSLLKNLGYLGYTSGFSLTCMVFFLGVVIYKRSEIPCPLPYLQHAVANGTLNDTHPMYQVALQNGSVDSGLNFMMDYIHSHTNTHEDKLPGNSLHVSGVEYEVHSGSGDECRPKYFVFNSQTSYTIPILAFAFVCHPEVLPIYSELKDRSRKKMQNVSNISILAMFLMYLLSAIFGYLTFFEHVEPELLHTYIKAHTTGVLLLLVRLAVLTAVTLTVPIVLFPVSSTLCYNFYFIENVCSGNYEFTAMICEQRFTEEEIVRRVHSSSDIKENVEQQELVHNMSHISLTSDYINLLNRGLNFIPRSQSKLTDPILDLKLFCRNVMLKLMYNNSQEEPPQTKGFIFKNLSDYVPVRHPLVEAFFRLTEDELYKYYNSNLRTNRLRRRDNLTPQERQCLRKLQNDPTIIIRPADKGDKVVVMDMSSYVKAMNLMLQDRFYESTSIDDAHCVIRYIIKVLDLELEMKKAVPIMLESYLRVNNINGSFQSSFQTRCNTEMALTRSFYDHLMMKDEHRYSVCAIFGISSKFNMVDHFILFDCLGYYYGITGIFLDWFTSYPSHPTSSVVTEVNSSDFFS
ncbi:sodium-coupled neutral amino acid transporter 4-like [Protopterus annectens]|uniref:sodium-coupled neutral amino acid transporter 4-like n=1 Tax=Protopterus annectens TaxID=7888 RepID=UPI001CFC0AE4|nr:sodium-coupled neutral amino acid transporter 4-like [Protopterus annectens]